MTDLQEFRQLMDKAAKLADKIYTQADKDFDMDLAYKSQMWYDYLRTFQREAASHD